MPQVGRPEDVVTRPAARRRHVRRPPLIAAILGVGMAAAACGSGSSGGTAPNSASTPGGTTTTPATGSSSLASAAATAASKAGGPTTLPTETIGYLRYIASDPGDQEQFAAFQDAAKVLNWKVIQCDGQGDPTAMKQCMNTLIADHVAAIINDGIPQALIAPELGQARNKGILNIYTGGSLTAGNTAIGPQTNRYDAGYVPPDGAMAAALAKYVTGRLAGLGSADQQMIDQTFPVAEWGNLRNDALKSALAGTNVKIVAAPQADSANLIQGTASQIGALLNQYPNVKVVWTTFDGSVVGAAQAVTTKYPGKSFPKAPMVVTFYTSKEVNQLIARGAVTASVTSPTPGTDWIAADQLAEYFARHTPLSPDVRPNYGKGLDFLAPTIVTKSNLPPAGQDSPAPKVDYASFFTQKWQDEFGGSSS